ncbi:MAG: efflux RND transporter permease subunit, partial [Bacteroidetes bacterium]|nr:efflux RND transporter permease subunit [Bacteroidota bacterium]
MNIIQSSLRHNQVSLVTIFLIFAVGIYSLLTMPRRSDPEITIRQGLVIALYPGATAQQVEEMVTKTIEDKLFTYSEVKKDETYSTTRDGLVYITVTLEDWVKDPDLFWERLGQGLFQLSKLSLPEGVLGPLVDSDFGDVVALLIAVESENYSYGEIKDYVEQIENSLRMLPALSKIEHLGFQEEEIEVAFDSEKLALYEINKSDVVEILKTQNTIQYSGYIEPGKSSINLYTTGLLSNPDEIREQIIGVSPAGSVVRIKDLAEVNRIQSDTTQLIRVNGNNSKVMLISLQMQDGYNIVKFGKEIDAVLEQNKKLLPQDLHFHTINNQPEVVQSAVNDFMREFLIAVVAVIIVIMLLLPFHIALIASISIPVSIGMTFTFLNLFGYELQQVSLASLVVVLGMVVDNAVVVIDSYIDKLDKGIKRFNAAWQSATEFAIPLISSTLSIIMAFLPLVFMLSGATGEFLITLPITVAISMTCSLVVAFFLTPFLAYVFIRKGLVKESPQTQSRKKGFSMLNAIQWIFDRSIDWAMRREALTVILGIAMVVFGVLMLKVPKQQFFPDAQRNQFIIQVFEPMGTKLSVTLHDVQKIEKVLQKDSLITAFASFSGTSAPRVYYSFTPEFPEESYAMFLVNTTSVKTTEELADKYELLFRDFLPDAQVDVMQFAQGVPVTSPVEVRIYGNNISNLERMGEQIKAVFRNTEGSRLIRQDFEKSQYLKVDVSGEEAIQMGFTTEVIAANLAIGLHGAPVSSLWEGDDALDINFRLKRSLRKNFDDIRNVYIESPVTRTSIPLRQIALLTPSWETGKITRRNGMPALTTGCKPLPGHLASGILAGIQPQIDTMKIMPGYTLEYGGDKKNQDETFGQMIIALIISLVSIFLILLFQFKEIARPLIIMISIPLTLFGSILGLVITGNV